MNEYPLKNFKARAVATSFKKFFKSFLPEKQFERKHAVRVPGFMSVVEQKSLPIRRIEPMIIEMRPSQKLIFCKNLPDFNLHESWWRYRQTVEVGQIPGKELPKA